MGRFNPFEKVEGALAGDRGLTWAPRTAMDARQTHQNRLANQQALASRAAQDEAMEEYWRQKRLAELLAGSLQGQFGGPFANEYAPNRRPDFDWGA